MKAEESVLLSAATAMQETDAVLKSASTEVETSPTVQKTSPTVQKTSPTVQESGPTVQETSPTVQETSPTVQETYLTEIDVDQLEAVWKPSTAVVLKKYTAATQGIFSDISAVVESSAEFLAVDDQYSSPNSDNLTSL